VPIVSKHEDQNITLDDLYRRLGATPELSELTRRNAKVQLIGK